MSMIHEITARAPRYKRPMRKGRGESSGHGKTSGRGTKGAGARGGGPHWKTGHEGGQTPLHRRLPARGFSNTKFERNYYIVNLGDLEQFQDGATVDVNALIAAKLVPDTKLPVKILGDGSVSKKLTVVAGWYSRSAHQKITAAGGTAQDAKGQPFVFPKPKPRFDKKAEKQQGGGKKEKKAKPAAEGAAPAPEAAKPAAEAAKPAEAPKAE